jgi:methylmalonyl-CoA mutase
MKYGIARIYSPDDGRHMGLEGMIEDLVKQCDFLTVPSLNGELKNINTKDWKTIARSITYAENGNKVTLDNKSEKKIPVLGITSTGGAGKSSVTDEIDRRFLMHYTDKTIAVISVDPSKKKQVAPFSETASV